MTALDLPRILHFCQEWPSQLGSIRKARLLPPTVWREGEEPCIASGTLRRKRLTTWRCPIAVQRPASHQQLSAVAPPLCTTSRPGGWPRPDSPPEKDPTDNFLSFRSSCSILSCCLTISAFSCRSSAIFLTYCLVCSSSSDRDAAWTDGLGFKLSVATDYDLGSRDASETPTA